MNKIWHYINFALIFLFLVGICLLEEYCVSTSLQRVQDCVYEIEANIEEKSSLRDVDLVMLVENLDYNWSKDERRLGYMVNHKSMQEIGTEIARLKGYIEIDNMDDFKISLLQIELHCDEYMHFMGASFHNIL